MMKKIINDYINIETTNDLFTEALIALESSEWDKCLKACKLVMDASTNIEQRLATMTLQSLAKAKDPNAVKEYLTLAYDI